MVDIPLYRFWPDGRASVAVIEAKTGKATTTAAQQRMIDAYNAVPSPYSWGYVARPEFRDELIKLLQTDPGKEG